MTPHAEALGRARTAADFAAVIALLDIDLSEAVATRQGLKQAEDRAIFGDGDLAAARVALDDCNDRIAMLERAIAAAGSRRASAAEREARSDIEALAEEIEGKAALLGTRWCAVRRLVEELREELFEADALSRAIATANGLFDAAGLPRLKVSLAATRRAAMAGPRAAVPARLSRAGLTADRQLLALIATGGALDPRPALRAPVGAAKKPKTRRG
ncbi:hypothetical protein RFM41_24450 [Mesorhizobium sp. VK25A]|uniref:Uncharacterized protein n=1 Tax=Mesorhizobium vachelliae TaxID=3072309 RepID=A0ABU5A992_9HYPH|nr:MULTISPECIES: hypothetical protein [unclassified Mesorhizobium]MDX8534278.1 hypothetical protein [Mesorhizobium sp. VK25D]MDX8546920.1 hypothetical protein [Mesorhizobium sp. VK25A]